jgi:hypothetical protein
MTAERTRLTAVLLALASWLLAIGGAHAQAVQKRLFALVVGSNHPGDTGLAPLAYADDDALRNVEVLRMLGADATVLVTADDDTRGKRALDHEPGAATMDNLRSALKTVFHDVDAAKAAGFETEFFFWFSGHGTAKGSGGVLFLDNGGTFSRGDLYKEVLRKSPATFNHVFIDACRAASFVSSRGDDDVPPPQRNQDHDSLDKIPNVGVIFGATREGRVHEWDTYEGGVFSFQLRSALLNAADVDNDKRVTYLEAFAFLTAANEEVQGEHARMHVVVHTPVGQRGRTISDWSGNATSLTVQLPAGRGLHVRFTDRYFIPLLELNKHSDDEVLIVLPKREGYSLQRLPRDLRDKEHASFSLGPLSGALDYDALLSGLVVGQQAPSRGSDVAPELEHGLFRVPFGFAYFRGVRATARAVSLRDRSPGAPMNDGVLDNMRAGPARPSAQKLRLRRSGYVMLGAAGAAAISGLVSWLASNESYTDYQQAADADRAELKAKTRRLDWAATASFAAAGAFALSATGLLVAGFVTPSSRDGVLASSAGLRVSGRF